MRLKKLLTVMLLIIICTLQFSFIQFNSFVYANEQEIQGENSGKYHYEQLTDEAKKYIMQFMKCMLVEL